MTLGRNPWRIPAAAALAAVIAGMSLALAQPARRGVLCPTTRTFYVDAQHGNDRRCGRSPQTAWRTVARVNRAHLRPGDQVLFHGGQVMAWGASRAGDGSDPRIPLRPRSGVTYASYGTGRAILRSLRASNGTYQSAVFLCRAHNATLRDLELTGSAGAEAAAVAVASGERRVKCRGSTGITLRHLVIGRWFEGVQAGYADSDWTIDGVRIVHTAGNGILFDRRDGNPDRGGDRLSVLRSTILSTGEHPPSGYAVHGIYDNASDSRLIGNTIESFQTDGISIRFRGATVAGNHIAGGGIGIGVFSLDPQGGVTRILRNAISNVDGGIFVCGVREGCHVLPDHVDLADNRFSAVRGQVLNLQPTAGGYDLAPSDRTFGWS